MMLNVETKSETELTDITSEVQDVISKSGVRDGICFVYVPHTTAAVTINENADPTVKADIMKALNQIVPREAGYRHSEGNSPAHVKSTLVGSSQMIFIENSRLQLGTWQGIFFCEFDGPRNRKVHVKILEGISHG